MVKTHGKNPIYELAGTTKPAFLESLAVLTDRDLLKLMRDSYALNGSYFIQDKIVFSPDSAAPDQPW